MSSPTVLRRRLAARLRQLRNASGLSQEQVAERLDFSKSKIIRIEKAQSRVSPGDLRLLLDLFEVRDGQRDELERLARDARKRGWWSGYSDVFTGSYIGLEQESSAIRYYSAQLLHGLMQTEGYAHAVIESLRPTASNHEIGRRVEARLARQSLLERPDAPQMWGVLDEAVIRRRIGDQDCMRTQLRHLVEISERPHITVQILPFAAGAHAGLEGGFTLLEFADPTDSAVAYVEGLFGDVYVEAHEEVDRHVLAFDHVRASALPPRESIALLAAAAKEL